MKYPPSEIIAAVGRFHAGHNGFFLRSLCPLRTYKFRQGYRQQRKTKTPPFRRGAMPFILRPRGTCPASGHRITNSVKAIVCATANTPASVRERNYPSLITFLIALSHKLNRAISAPARQCIKMPTVSTKCSHFSVLSIILPSIIYRNTTVLPCRSQYAARRPFSREGRLSFITVTQVFTRLLPPRSPSATQQR